MQPSNHHFVPAATVKWRLVAPGSTYEDVSLICCLSLRLEMFRELRRGGWLPYMPWGLRSQKCTGVKTSSIRICFVLRDSGVYRLGCERVRGGEVDVFLFIFSLRDVGGGFHLIIGVFWFLY